MICLINAYSDDEADNLMNEYLEHMKSSELKHSSDSSQETLYQISKLQDQLKLLSNNDGVSTFDEMSGSRGPNAQNEQKRVFGRKSYANSDLKALSYDKLLALWNSRFPNAEILYVYFSSFKV